MGRKMHTADGFCVLSLLAFYNKVVAEAKHKHTQCSRYFPIFLIQERCGSGGGLCGQYDVLSFK